LQEKDEEEKDTQKKKKTTTVQRVAKGIIAKAFRERVLKSLSTPVVN